MKLFVTYDKQGNIVGVGMPNPDMAGDIGIIAGADYAVCEVEVKGKPSDFKNEDRAATKVAEIVEQFQVEVAPKKAKLVRRKSESK